MGTNERAEHTEEELTLYKRKAVSWKGVHVKKAKTAAHAHATREDSSDSVTSLDLKRYEGRFYKIFTTDLSMTLPNLLPIA